MEEMVLRDGESKGGINRAEPTQSKNVVCFFRSRLFSLRDLKKTRSMIEASICPVAKPRKRCLVLVFQNRSSILRL